MNAQAAIASTSQGPEMSGKTENWTSHTNPVMQHINSEEEEEKEEEEDMVDKNLEWMKQGPLALQGVLHKM